MKSLIETAREFAIKCHQDANHQYDGHPYEIHLKHVVSVAELFITLIPVDSREVVLSSCWTHDTIEDTRQTYNDVKKVLGEEVAEIVYALTNEKGKSRQERANDKYYEGIKSTPYAIFVKLCDRIANVQYSKNKGSRMFEVYGRENEEFMSKIYHPSYEPMFSYLKSLFNS